MGQSSSSIVPTALAPMIVTPSASAFPVTVTLNVSSSSVSVSAAVDTEKLPSVSPAVIVTLPPVTAV